MKIQFRSVCLSAHLDSFCRAVNEKCRGEFEFVYKTDDPGAMRRLIGWKTEASFRNGFDDEAAQARALEVDVLYGMLREPDLFEARVVKGKKTVYAAERWLKPLVIKGVRLPAILRMLVPGYRKMVRRFVKLMDDPNFYLLPIGVHACRDFVRLYRLMHGDWRCWWRTPEVKIERRLGGEVEGFPRMRLWAYFVERSLGGLEGSVSTNYTNGHELGVGVCGHAAQDGCKGEVKVFWCGRMLGLKRVDVLIKAVKKFNGKFSLLLVGEGPERKRLEKLAKGCDYIRFENYKPQSEVRRLMREASVYVMSSNAEEGWGAVIGEALSEGCPVISTYEVGSAVTLLSENWLYHANSVDELVGKLCCLLEKKYDLTLGDWSGSTGAHYLLNDFLNN